MKPFAHRWLVHISIWLGGVPLAFVLLVTILVTQTTPRTWLLQKISQHVGWDLAVKKVLFSLSPPKMHLQHLAIMHPDGLHFTLPQGVVGLDPSLWIQGRVPFVELENPHLQWATLTVKPGQQTTLLPLVVQRLRITAGSLNVPITHEQPIGRFREITIVGEELSLEQGVLTFSAKNFQKGTIQGKLHWDNGIHMRATIAHVQAAPLLSLLGMSAQEGTVQTVVDLHMAQDHRTRATISGRVDRLRLSNGWEGSWDGTFHTQANQWHIQWHGLTRPSQHAAFAPTQGMATLSHGKEGWKIETMTGAFQPFIHFKGRGEIFPKLQQQIDLTIPKPFSLGMWWGSVLPASWQWSVSQPWHANLTLSGTVSNPRWHAQLQTGQDQVVFQNLSLRNLVAKVQGHTQEQEANQTKYPFSVEITADQLRQGENDAQNLHLNSQGFFLLDEAAWFLSNAKVDFLWGKQPLHWQGTAHGTLAGFSEMDGLLSSEGNQIQTHITQGKEGYFHVNLAMDDKKPIPLNTLKRWLPPTWLVKGSLSGQAALTAMETGWSGQLDLKLQQVQWSQTTPDNEKTENTESMAPPLTLLGENFAGRLKGRFLWVETEPNYFKGRWHLHKGEWLIGSVYGDLEAESLSVDLSWRDGKPWSLTMLLRSQSIPEMHVRLSPFRTTGFSGRLRLKKSIRLNRLFNRYLRDIWVEEHPEWATVVLRGRLSTDLHVTWQPQKKLRLTGWLALNQGRIQGPEDQWGIHGMTLFLPLAKETARANQQKPGYLHLEQIYFKETSLSSQNMQPVWQDETLQFLGTLEGNLLDGQFRMENIQIADAWSTDRTVSFALHIKNGDMAPLSQQMGWPGIEGHWQVGLRKVQWKNNKIKTDGFLSAQIFGGELRLNDLSAEQPLKDLPLWQTSMQLSHIDLEALSHWMGVGSIQGTLSGTVKDLVMAGTEPLSFSAKVASEESDTPQRISVKAIKNIQMLGSGSASGILQKGLLSFFDSFGYKKIGFQCQLENDTFHLQGVESRKGKEYLVVGSLFPPRVDVVSHNPTIAWKDMVNRLKRIETGPETENLSEPTTLQGDENP